MSSYKINNNIFMPGVIERMEKNGIKSKLLLAELKTSRDEVYTGIAIAVMASIGIASSLPRNPRSALTFCGLTMFGCDYAAVFIKDAHQIIRKYERVSEFVNNKNNFLFIVKEEIKN